MNKTCSLSEISKTGSLNSSLTLKVFELGLMARFMERKAMSPKLTQNEFGTLLGYSSATVKRYRKDINMPSPHRIQSNTIKRKQTFSNDFSNNEHEPN